MTRGVQHREAEILKWQFHLVRQRDVDRESIETVGKKGELREVGPVENGLIIGMHGDRRAGFLLQPGNAGHVVDVPMRHQNALGGQALLPKLRPYPGQLQAGIDDQGGPRIAAADDEAVFGEEIIVERRDRELFAERLRRRHAIATSAEAGVRTCGPASVINTISSRRTPPQSGM